MLAGKFLSCGAVLGSIMAGSGEEERLPRTRHYISTAVTATMMIYRPGILRISASNIQWFREQSAFAASPQLSHVDLSDASIYF